MATTDTGGQVDSGGGGWENPDDIDTTDVDATTEDNPGEVGSNDDAGPDAGDDGDVQQNSRPGKAAQLRRRAQDAEAERDQLRQQLSETWQDIVDDIARRERLDSRLLRAGERDIAEFVQENGLLDRDAIKGTLRTLARELGVHRGIAPNPMQGHHFGGSTGRGDVGSTINKALGR